VGREWTEAVMRPLEVRVSWSVVGWWGKRRREEGEEVEEEAWFSIEDRRGRRLGWLEQ
jgi:hypothetical protein